MFEAALVTTILYVSFAYESLHAEEIEERRGASLVSVIFLTATLVFLIKHLVEL